MLWAIRPGRLFNPQNLEVIWLGNFRNSQCSSALLHEWEVVLSWRHEAKTASLQSSSQEKRQHQEIQYRIRNWHDYNESLVQRGSITLWTSEEDIRAWKPDGPRKRGGQVQYWLSTPILRPQFSPKRADLTLKSARKPLLHEMTKRGLPLCG